MTPDVSTCVNWTRPQTLAALHIYLQLPLGQLHQRYPNIRQLAQWIGRISGSVALKLVNLASLDPVIVAGGRSGMGNASALDRQVWQELQANWDAVALAAAAEYEGLARNNGVQPDQDLQDDIPRFEDDVLLFGEGKAVISSYKANCCISGLQHEKLVIASHIVPWSEDTKNRLNPQNGLCLSALHDRAFDQGLITVMPDFTVRVSAKVKASKGDSFITENLLRFDHKPIRFPVRFGPRLIFLEWHARRFGYLV